MPPLVPGFVMTGGAKVRATGAHWAAVRVSDGLRCTIEILPVADLPAAKMLATKQLAIRQRIGNEHLVRQHAVFALADGTLALVVDEVEGGSLAELVAARGQLTTGETVTTVAPLFGALADLHETGLVHGDLAPGSIEFTADGRPMICDLGVAGLSTSPARAPSTGPRTWTATGTRTASGTASREPAGSGGPRAGGFEAPEILRGQAASSGSDVYAMAALGWFCLTGSPPDPEASRLSLSRLRPETPPRLAEILTACLDADPARRPSAAAAAADVFDAAPAESVALTAVSDPAAEITRRIRAAAVPAPRRASRVSTRRPVGLGVAAALLGILVASVAAGAWFTLRGPAAEQQTAAPSTTRSPAGLSMTAIPRPTLPFTLPAGRSVTVTPRPALPLELPVGQPVTATPRPTLPPAFAAVPSAPTEVVTASDSPRLAPAPLLQALVDARALAYVARSAPLLDLVYAKGAPKADIDRSNIATAVKNGGTYLGLSFFVRDVAFLTGTTDTAKIRATIVTPAYRTGQLDGRKVSHPPETLGPCVFTLRLTPDGWRVLTLSSP